MEMPAFGVLAGGKSSRMGTDKTALTLQGKSFLQLVLEAGGAFPQKIISVTNRADFERNHFLTDQKIQIVEDRVPGLGPIEGIRNILAVSRFAATLIVAADMPGLSPALFDAFLSHHRPGRNLILTLHGFPEPLCSVYTAECLPVLEELLQAGIRRPLRVCDTVQTDYISLEELGFPDEVLCNINTREAYRALIQS